MSLIIMNVVRIWLVGSSPFQCGDRFYTSDSDVYRRQVLTSKVNPRTEKVKIFTMAVDQQHRYSNEAERAS